MEVVVSVIIPFYNRFNLVENALKMLDCQTFRNFEVILINDGSEAFFYIDDIKKTYDFPIIYETFSKNKGPGVARKKGRLLAQGKYIVYLDSDDWWSNNFLNECVSTLQLDDSIGMVYTNTVKLFHNKEIGRRIQNDVPITILPSLFQDVNRLWSTPSCLWRREVSLSENWLSLRDHEDYVHDALCAKINNKIKFVKDALTFNNQSASDRTPRDAEEVRKAIHILAHMEYLPSYEGISFFYLSKLRKNSIRLTIRDVIMVLKLPHKEFSFFSSHIFIFYSGLFLNYFNLFYYFQKRWIKKLQK